MKRPINQNALEIGTKEYDSRLIDIGWNQAIDNMELTVKCMKRPKYEKEPIRNQSIGYNSALSDILSKLKN